MNVSSISLETITRSRSGRCSESSASFEPGQQLVFHFDSSYTTKALVANVPHLGAFRSRAHPKICKC